ncbi:MAG: N-acetyltransferase family protein [Phycisphaerales bacterium]
MIARIRGVEDADFAAIADLTNEYIRKTAIHFSYEPVTDAELRDLWWPKRDRYPFLVATDERGEFLGYAKAGVWRERYAYRWIAEVGIYVMPFAQRGGVGRALYGQLVDECRERGLHSLVGGITLPNDASVRLHEAMGFVKVAHFARAGWKFGRWHDVGFWQLMLRDADEAPDEHSV